MTKIEDMLKELCPNGVEWKELGEVVDVLDSLRKPITKSKRINGHFPYYGANGIQDFVADYIFDGTYILMGEDGSVIKNDNTPILHWVTGKIWVNNHAHILSEKKNFAYQLKRKFDIEKEFARGSTLKTITKQEFSQFQLPIPSLEIQSRIVQVLDNFDTVCNDLNIGLPKEIELRQKQYEYFRDKLLTFTAEGVYTDSTVQYRQDLIRLLTWVFGPIRVSLGAICDFTRGNGLQKKDFTDQGQPVIHYGQIYTRYGFSTQYTVSFTSQSVFDRLKKAKTNDIVMATTSENIEDVGKAVVWEGKGEIGIGGHSCALHTEQHSRYVAYCLQTSDFQRQKEKLIVGTKVIELYPKNIERVVITLPPLDTQALIVSILDKFDILTTDLTQGLPKEIELRQKQYEYFRDKLLTF